MFGSLNNQAKQKHILNSNVRVCIDLKYQRFSTNCISMEIYTIIDASRQTALTIVVIFIPVAYIRSI